jgi:hypothetical protein
MGAAVEKLDPELVAPVVTFLAHEDCPVTGEVYSVGGGRVARFFIGMTHGYFKKDLTVEDVSDHLDQIRNEEGYTVPEKPTDEFALMFQMMADG